MEDQKFTYSVSRPMRGVRYAANMQLRIKEWRKARGLSQLELAEAAGMRVASISTAETGRGNPTIGTLGRIADVLGVTIRDLLPVDAEVALLEEAVSRLQSLDPATRAAIETLIHAGKPESPEEG